MGEGYCCNTSPIALAYVYYFARGVGCRSIDAAAKRQYSRYTEVDSMVV